MSEETKPTTVPSEQTAAPAASPSQQDQVAESTTPVETATPEPKAEPTQREDPDAILRSVREQTRRDLESEYGKKTSEAIRYERERAAAERDDMLKRFGQYVPDDEVAQYKQAIQQRSSQEELNYYRHREVQDSALRQRAEVVRSMDALVQKAGLTFKDLPSDVIGSSEVGFPERFAEYTAKRLLDANKDADKREKRAREEAERETEKRLGVSRVSGASPTGSGHSGVGELSEQIATAAARGDKARVAELRDALYKEVGVGR